MSASCCRINPKLDEFIQSCQKKLNMNPFSLKYSSIFELFQRSTSWHSWPKIEECVGCFVCFNKNNLFFFNPSVLVPPISVLQFKHHNLLEPRASCAKNVQNENSVCGPASNVDGGRWVVVVGWWAQLSYSGTSLVEATVRRCSPLVLPLLLSSARAWPGRTQARTFSTTRGKVSMPSFSSDYCKRVLPVKMEKVLLFVRGMLTPTAM